MLDITKIEEAIDLYVLTEPEESYHTFIPCTKGKKRNYLGLSGLGEECLRKVWFDWRQVAAKVFPPRLYRLFRRGAREEFVFINLLRGIGFTIFDVDSEGKQWKVSDFEGHLSGHTDGVGKAPKKFWRTGSKPVPFLLEFKTYNEKRFKELQKRGVAKSDPKYYVQIQGYMGYEKLEGCLFCAVNKNTDELYFEWVSFKASVFEERVVGNAELIITSQTPPPKMANSISDWRCKFCDFKDNCHKGKASDKTCRACKFAEPAENATWKCTKGGTYGEVCGKWKDIAK